MQTNNKQIRRSLASLVFTYIISMSQGFAQIPSDRYEKLVVAIAQHIDNLNRIDLITDELNPLKSFDMTKAVCLGHFPFIEFTNIAPARASLDDLRKLANPSSSKKKNYISFMPGPGELYFKVNVFPPGSQMAKQRFIPPSCRLPDGGAIFLHTVSGDDVAISKIIAKIEAFIQAEKERF